MSLFHRLHSRLPALLLGTLWTILLSSFVLGNATATELKIALVLSDDNPIYLRFAETYKEALPATHSLSILLGADSDPVAQRNADLIVTVGSRSATTLVGKTNKPLLLSLLPSKLFAELSDKQSGPFSALYVDQPWSRHIELLFAALPRAQRIAVLESDNAAIKTDELRKLIARHDAKLITQEVSTAEQLYGALEEILSNADVLLATPDSVIYSSNNIRNILMTSYRYRVPLFGLSKGYVNAGALCAVYSSPEALARQAVAMSLVYAQSRHLPPPQYPTEYEVATNPEVARTLGIKLKSVEQLHQQLLHAEGRR